MKQPAALKADCCVASYTFVSAKNAALEHTAKPTADGEQACTPCVKGSTSLRMYEGLIMILHFLTLTEVAASNREYVAKWTNPGLRTQPLHNWASRFTRLSLFVLFVHRPERVIDFSALSCTFYLFDHQHKKKCQQGLKLISSFWFPSWSFIFLR